MKKIDYSNDSVEFLLEHKKDCEKRIKDIQSKVKQTRLKLTAHNGRGFSKERKAFYQGIIDDAPRLYAIYEDVIGQIKAELASR